MVAARLLRLLSGDLTHSRTERALDIVRRATIHAMNVHAPPPTLWHYTDAQGFLGIVTSSLLRFGDARFLNDRSERVYGERIISEVLSEEVTADTTGNTAACHTLLSATLPDRLFVCSFSETSEAISQWQRYGADGFGYCLGFDPRRLDDLFDEYDIFLKAMVYDVHEQRELARKAIRMQVAAETKRKAANGFMSDVLFADTEIDHAKLLMKNPSFRDEKEWRCILRLLIQNEQGEADGEQTGNLREEYCPRGSYIKPFLALPHHHQGAPRNKLPIVGVVCGPKLDGDLSIATARRFLRSHGYDVSVLRSELADVWR